MKKKLTFLMFSLLLAVGWTSTAHAQKLPDKSLAEVYTSFIETAQGQSMPDVESAEIRVTHRHATTGVKTDANRPSTRLNAPARAGQELVMKSLTKAEADAIFYDWTDSEGSHTSKASDVAKKPEQMYALLREVYTNKAFPGPYYSAYTKDDVRERQVYYGAIDGGWEIDGPTVSNPTATFIRSSSVSSSTTVADGSSTTTGYTYIPVYGYYFETVQKTQMIYSKSILGLQSGDIITSLTFYPRNGIRFSGGNVKLSLANTTTSSITSTSGLSISTTQVAATGNITANDSQTEWTINFDQPFTYTGDNLLVQIDTEAGSWGGSSTYGFYGTEQSDNVSFYSYSGGSTKNTSKFLPKATFAYTGTRNEEVTYNPATQIGDITISGDTEHVMVYSITVKSGNTTLFSWDYVTDGTASSTSTGYWPAGMDLDRWKNWSSGGTRVALGFTTDDNGNLEKIKLGGWLFLNYSNVTVTIDAKANSSSSTASLSVNGVEKTFTSRDNYTWPITAASYPYTKYDPDYYKPNEEGYTALIVAVKNQTAHAGSMSAYDGSYFTTKDQIINYFANNVDSIQLLTDGMRIGSGSDYSIGTVFNSSGTYNKFFYLGKGQAKQKPDLVINSEIAAQHALGEYVPFKQMFEQFSPTQGGAGDEITDFYSLLNEGYVYNVVHDCRDVIWLHHQFSMSGNDGTKPYAMTGMNFFIPDYRLKYWEDTYHYGNNPEFAIDYTVDGRITNPYQAVSDDGNPKLDQALMFKNNYNFSFWYAWYNQNYPPKVGLYKITLEAVATPVEYDYTAGNLNYAVTLTWVSSLNEMTGHDVPQIYTVYYWDPITGEKKYVEAVGITDGKTGLTTVTYLVEQFPTSYKIEYIVEGTPNDGNEHPQWVAVSNVDDVIIPGWNDFVGLELDHHESDFVVNDMANYYRNFLVVVNEDLANGLTVGQINDPVQPMNEFNLYRFEYGDNDEHINEKKIATLEFSNATNEQVSYEITYDENNEQEQYKPQGEEDKYDLDEDHLDVPLTGVIRVKGNGDIVIWPNGYHVNFKSITIKNDGNVIASWNADEDDELPSGWYMSSGSRWDQYTTTNTNDKVGYVEGGGYIYIPNMMNNSNYTNLTVEIEAYGDGANVSRITVNDKMLNISNTTGNTYTWGTNETPLSPNAAPKRDYNGSITAPIASKGNSNSNVINNSNK